MKTNLGFYCFVTGAGSISQRYGSEDPHPHPDPYQNVTDPGHWYQQTDVTHTAERDKGRIVEKWGEGFKKVR
jgi:hypothetical protein